MAEFLAPQVGERIAADTWSKGDSGFAAMGKPIPYFRKSAALKHLREMGLTDFEQATACVNQMSNKLERDDPYLAMAAGMKYLNLTGTYRLMAVLLTAPDETVSV